MDKNSRNLILIVILSSFVLQIACAQVNREQSNDRKLQPPKTTPVEEISYKLGDTIDLGGRKIIVYGFQPHNEARMKDLYNTSHGQAAEVLVENTGSAPFFLNPIHFSVEDGEGSVFTYYNVKVGGKSPRIESMQIAPGQKIRGFVTYVNGDLNPSIIYYRSSDGKAAKIAVK